MQHNSYADRTEKEGGGGRRLPVTRACCAHARLGEEHTHERLLCEPRRDSARDQQGERGGGECAGNAIKCPLPGVEERGSTVASLPEARCWCDYCDGLRCCFIFFISYVCIIDDDNDEPDNNGEASGHGRWKIEREGRAAQAAVRLFGK